MSNTEFDLIVIGAGATGSSIALEASKRNLKVALLDAGDISGGTSCRSTKLLHGGVRYLELAFKNLDLAQLTLVREALIERGHWLKQAPFLAHQIELTIPMENCFKKAYYGIGLSIYDTLAGNTRIAKSRMISVEEMEKSLPLLKRFPNGGVVYSDGQFDDARLNILIALTAEKNGAILETYCKVVDFEYKPTGEIKGVITRSISGGTKRWSSKAVVNATGIKVDSLRRKADNDLDHRIIASRGVHLVLEENLCPQKSGILLPSTDDGRVMFILPFYGHTLVGTTDTQCKIEDAHKPSKQEELYLIHHLTKLFPKLKSPIPTSSWSGARPLLKTNNSQSSSQIVREHEIEILPCGLITAMGGKWTTCRKIALDTLNALETLFARKLPEPKNIPLMGSHLDPDQTKNLLKTQFTQLRECLPKTNHSHKQISHLQTKYGLNALNIIKKSNPENLFPLSESLPLCKAEIYHDIIFEHAKTPTDLLARRSRLAMINLEEAKRLLPIIQECLEESSLPCGELNLEA